MAGFGGSVKLTGESEYRKALQQITQNLKEVSSEMKVVSTAYDKNDNSVEALAVKEETLNKKLTEQTNKLQILTNRYNEMNNTYGQNSAAQQKVVAELEKEKAKLDEIGRTLGTTSKEYQAQQKVVADLEGKQTSYTNAVSNAKIEMNKAQAEVNKTTKELDALGKETKETANDIKSAGDGFTVFKGVIADLSSKAIQSAIAGMKKLGEAIINVGKQSISSYANYEQLVGGVETLFKDSSNVVQRYAENAYKTAGLSANEYMETVTSFSASLLQSLGQDTEKAANYADQAIIDMSDNANKMGTSMEMIQNAYQGFAKQNYTMLDNLKLGYGGTKTEMQRLIADANKVKEANGEMANLTISSFADVTEAIHIIQTEMGITGTTTLEAEKTITGSVNSMKASWQNLLTAIADDNADMGKSVDAFVDATIKASQNLVPRIKKVVDGIKKLLNSIVNDVFPKLKKAIPELTPLIDVFSWFIKNKTLVVGSITAMVGAFALNKINQWTTSLSNAAKGLISIIASTTAASAATQANTIAQAANTTAQIAGTTATTGLTAATNLLNAAWKANPVGLVVAGVTAAIGVFTLFKSKTEELTEAEKQHQEQLQKQQEIIDEQKASWEELQQAKQKQIDTGMTEISHYETLIDELMGITDANGKVKDGYEERARFILDTLNNALGTEYQMTGNIISNYGELTSSIQKLIDQKKAKIILDAQEGMYTEALQKQGEAIKNLTAIRGELTAAQEVYNQKKQEENAAWDLYQQKVKTMSEEDAKYYRNKYTQAAAASSQAWKEVSEQQTRFNEQESQLKQYAYNIDLYEKNLAASHAGNYDQMSTVTWDYVAEYQNAGDAQKKAIEDKIKEEETYFEWIKSQTDENGNYLYQSQVNASAKRLEQLKQSLTKYNETTKNELYNNEKSWLENAATVLSKLSDKEIEFRKVGNDQVQYYENGIAMGKPMATSEAESVVKSVLSEFDAKAEAEGAGKDTITGFTRGEGNFSLQNAAFRTARNFASNILSTMKSKLGIASPSKETKEMGKFLLQGLGIGIEDEESDILKQARTFGEDVITSLNDGLSDNSVNSDIFGDITSNIPNNVPIKYNLEKQSNAIASNNNIENVQTNMVDAFKSALSQMKIELDDEVAGKFVDKTVTNLIYT